MTNWLIGLILFWGLVFIISQFSKPVNRGITDKDYKRMQEKWRLEDEEKQMEDDFLEVELEIKKKESEDKATRRNDE